MAVNQLKSDMTIGLIIHLSKLARHAATELTDCTQQFNQLNDIVQSNKPTPDEQKTSSVSVSSADVLANVDALNKQFQLTSQQLNDYANVLAQKVKQSVDHYLDDTDIDHGQSLIQAVRGNLSLKAINVQLSDITNTSQEDLPKELSAVILHTQPAAETQQQLSVIGDHLQTVLTNVNAAEAIVDQLETIGG